MLKNEWLENLLFPPSTAPLGEYSAANYAKSTPKFENYQAKRTTPVEPGGAATKESAIIKDSWCHKIRSENPQTGLNLQQTKGWKQGLVRGKYLTISEARECQLCIPRSLKVIS